MVTDVPGLRVGHWSGDATGVTVVLAPAGATGAGEVRGGAPATREAALLEHGTLVTRIDAVVLCGGAALGLAAADGVVRYLADRGQGFPTSGGPVPIVAAAAIFDLDAASAAPGPAEGRAAAEAAAGDGPDERPATGRVGAGRGATVGKWRGVEHRSPGGLGSAVERDDEVVVWALAVVNAAGDVVGEDGGVLAGSGAGSHAEPGTTEAPPFPEDATAPFENTTLAVVATNAALDKAQCRLVAESAHDGLARAIFPAHTRFDGDMTFAVATGDVAAHPDRVRATATRVVAGAIRSAVS